MVFQSHALWTHMNVFKNLAFGLKLRRLPADEIKRKVDAVLELVGLGGYGTRMTHHIYQRLLEYGRSRGNQYGYWTPTRSLATLAATNPEPAVA